MTRLSDAEREALQVVAARVSDDALTRLAAALPEAGSRTSEVRDFFRQENRARQVRSELFAPLTPFVSPGLGAASARLPPSTIHTLWSLARSQCPELTTRLSDDIGKPGVLVAKRAVQDELCRGLADTLALPRDASARAAVAALDETSGGAASAAVLLALSPEIREALPKLETWTHHLTAKSATSLRSAFGAAAKLGDDAGPLFLEALSAQMAEPCRVLRLISLILDQPTDQFLVDSALAPLCERLIAGIGSAVDEVRRFQPGLEGSAHQVGAAVMRAAQALLEFEQWVEVSRVGPWSARLAALRRALALEVEERLRATPRIMAEALPTRSARWSQRSARRTPKLSRDPDGQAVARAEAVAAFIGAIRISPSTSGFAALLAQTAASLDDQLDGYVEGLLDLLHQASAEDRPRLLAFLDVTACLTEHLGGEAAGRIVRRRAAAA